MYSTNRNIQIKLNHKLCKIKSWYIKLQYNVCEDFSLPRLQHHVFLRLVKPTLKADLWEQYMLDVPLKSIRLFLSHILLKFSYMKWRKMLFLEFHVFLNNFLLKHARDWMFWQQQVVNIMTKKLLGDFWNFAYFQNGSHFCPKIGKNYDFWDKNGCHFENILNFKNPLITFFCHHIKYLQSKNHVSSMLH